MMGLMSNVTSVVKSEALFTAPSGESLSVGSMCVHAFDSLEVL